MSASEEMKRLGVAASPARARPPPGQPTIIGKTESWRRSAAVVTCEAPQRRKSEERSGAGRGGRRFDGLHCRGAAGAHERLFCDVRPHREAGSAGLGLARQKEEHPKPAAQSGARAGKRRWAGRGDSASAAFPPERRALETTRGGSTSPGGLERHAFPRSPSAPRGQQRRIDAPGWGRHARHPLASGRRPGNSRRLCRGRGALPLQHRAIIRSRAVA